MIGTELLGPWLEEPETAVLLLDFDGTLAPIVADPEGAAALPASVEALRDVARRLGRVGVVSGRPVRFLMRQLAPVAGAVRLVGLYGLEWADGGEVLTHPEAEPFRPALAAAGGRAAAESLPGVTVEDKGLAVTIHARRNPDALPWVERFGAEVAGEFGLEIQGGRMSVELRAPVAIDKGTVVSELSAGWRASCYVGDDRGDLPAFAALSRLRLGGTATLAVAATSDEAPPELLAAADLVIDGPEGVLKLLRALATG